MKDQIFRPLESIRDHIVENFPNFFWAVVGLLLFIFAGILLRKLTQRRLMKRMDDTLLVNFIGRVILIIFISIGCIFFLNGVGLGTAAGGLLAGAGVSAIIIGFAFKDIGENFLAGFFLAFSRPFAIGDLIEVEGVKGNVKAMNFRNTHVRTFDGQDIFVPNAMLIKNPLSNYTRDGLLRYHFVIGIDYGDDIARAMEAILTRLQSMEELEQRPGLKPFVMIERFGTSTVNLDIYFWINSWRKAPFDDVISIRNKAMAAGLEALTQSGFTLPADIVELKIYQEGQPIPLKMTQ